MGFARKAECKTQGSYGHRKPGKVIIFVNGYFKKVPKVFEKSWKMCYINNEYAFKRII